MFYFKFLRILMKNRKNEGTRKTGHHWPLRCSKGHPRQGEVLRCSEGLPRRGEAEGLEKAPSCSPRRSPASPRRSHCLQWAKIFILFRKSRISAPIV